MNADDQDETQRAEIASKGGQARAAKLTPEKRSTIAKEAAQKRWAEAKHDAAEVSSHRVLESFKSVLDLAGMQLPCAIVQGPEGIIRVLSETGITNAILGNRSGASKRLKKAGLEGGARVPIFIAPRQLKPFIDQEILGGPSPLSITSTATASCAAMTPPFWSKSAMSGCGPVKLARCKNSNCRRLKRQRF